MACGLPIGSCKFCRVNRTEVIYIPDALELTQIAHVVLEPCDDFETIHTTEWFWKVASCLQPPSANCHTDASAAQVFGAMGKTVVELLTIWNSPSSSSKSGWLGPHMMGAVSLMACV